jgi:uncharacterized protein
MAEQRIVEQHVVKISQELSLKPHQVLATAGLLAEGGTVPFIARYRKEATGMLDEVAITAIRDRLGQLAELDARREAILKSLDERKLLTDDLRAKVAAAETMTTWRTCTSRTGRSGGPGDDRQGEGAGAAGRPDPRPGRQDRPGREAARFVTRRTARWPDELKVPDVAAALQGARDVIAERVSDDADARKSIRELFLTRGCSGAR